MSAFNEQWAESIRKTGERDRRVLAGEEPAPACFTCKAPSTYVSTGVTPAGYYAFQCAKHAPKVPAPLWGSDPGWQTYYVPLDSAIAYLAEHGRPIPKDLK